MGERREMIGDGEIRRFFSRFGFLVWKLFIGEWKVGKKERKETRGKGRDGQRGEEQSKQTRDLIRSCIFSDLLLLLAV